MHRVNKEFRYAPKSTKVGTPLVEIIRRRRGVCQDFAHIMIGALRSMGLAARYVNGYLRSGQGSEASHAWVSVFVPGTGSLGFDPTNDVLPAVATSRSRGGVTSASASTRLKWTFA
jgi:transglutaminase-like putative cysteine protease